MGVCLRSIELGSDGVEFARVDTSRLGRRSGGRVGTVPRLELDRRQLAGELWRRWGL